MDAQKIGQFIAAQRNETGLTQAELGRKLQVTDKAVSKWERGLGFPNINTLGTLADALDVSIAELMKSERIEEMNDSISTEAIANTIELADEQRKLAEKKSIRDILIVAAALTALVLLIDNMNAQFMGFLVFLPLAAIFGGIVLLVMGVARAIRKQPCKRTILMKANNAANLINWGLIVALFVVQVTAESAAAVTVSRVVTLGLLYIGARNLIELCATLAYDKRYWKQLRHSIIQGS